MPAVLATSRIRAESQLEFEIVGSFDGYRVGGQRRLPWPPGEAEHSSGELWRGDHASTRRFPPHGQTNKSKSVPRRTDSVHGSGGFVCFMIAPSSLRPDRSVSVEFGRWPCHPSVTLQRGFQRYAKGQHGTGWDRDPSDIEAIEGNGPSCFMFSIAPIGFESRPGH